MMAGMPMKTKHNAATISVQKKRRREPRPGRVTAVFVAFALDDGAVSDDRSLRYDDDSLAYEVVVPVVMVAARLVEYANI